MPLIHYKLYDTVNNLPDSWDRLQAHDLFLKTNFLKGLEYSCPDNITPFYVGIFKAEALVGIAIIQRVEMYFDDIFRDTSDKYLYRKAKQIVAKIVRGNALIIGNLMHTGQHGLYCNTQVITFETYLNTLDSAICKIKAEIKDKQGKKIRIIAFKDYFEDDVMHQNRAFFKKHNMYKVEMQPNMIFELPESWNSVDDYTSSLKKKYRDRYKTARKKGLNIIKKELTLAEIKSKETELFQLYKTVSDNAGVNSFVLCDHHFSRLKQELENQFKIFAYFLEDILVGFYTLILNNNRLETYFLGYNKALQYKHQLYLNMLYDMASFAIENKYSAIIYARTAMEIKSSVGAKPRTMYIYMKHTNNLVANTLLKFIVKYLNPITVWQERHPFN
ncbi:GNAT family N-acetyltransferase [Lacinutrix sp. Hel_I_90]|uniref:GNAT family N-acetyltransferase n=1 Tax=Lacinutrix sp. Hel_I_90 TaxID=1249999 RepID=UPI001E6274A4|nr:GNAT family N-acetyltransferase [Lacinutrix sp. Hel_I_90]